MPQETRARHPSRALQEGQHVAALDGLRGIAIVFVMFYHFVVNAGFGGDALVTQKIIGIAECMFSGVDLFFVLSGFLITGVLVRAKSTPGYFRNFYMRRVLRIFPLYYGSLAVIFLIVPHFVSEMPAAVRRVYDAQGWLWAYSQDIAITVHNEDYFDPDWLWLGHFWSLAVEEHFYLVWPLVVFFCRRRALIGASVGLILAAPLVRMVMIAIGMGPAAVYTLTLCRTDELAFGGLLAVLAQTWSYDALARLARWCCVGVIAYLALARLAGREPLYCYDPSVLSFGLSALAAGSGALIVYALAPRRNHLQRLLESPHLRAFGKYSYGAYVIHLPMHPVYLRLFPPQTLAAFAARLGHTGSRLVGLLGYFALGTAATMLLAAASFHAFERQFLKLKRHFEYSQPAVGTRTAMQNAASE